MPTDEAPKRRSLTCEPHVESLVLSLINAKHSDVNVAAVGGAGVADAEEAVADATTTALDARTVADEDCARTETDRRERTI